MDVKRMRIMLIVSQIRTSHQKEWIYAAVFGKFLEIPWFPFVFGQTHLNGYAYFGFVYFWSWHLPTFRRWEGTSGQCSYMAVINTMSNWSEASCSRRLPSWVAWPASSLKFFHQRPWIYCVKLCTTFHRLLIVAEWASNVNTDKLG